MASQHPIYDHINRDAHGRPPKRATSDRDGLIPPPQAPKTPSNLAYSDQTRASAKPIPKKRSWFQGVLRMLMLKQAGETRPVPSQAALKDSAAKEAGSGKDKHLQRLVAVAQRRWLRQDSAAHQSGRASEAPQGKFVDVLTATPGEPKLPDEAFARLRWGGAFLYVAPDEKSAQDLAQAYDRKRGFILEEPVTQVHANLAGMRIPGVTPHGYAFLARKVQLIQPGDFTERFTYHVELSRCPKSELVPDGYVVTKRVPTYADLIRRLRHKFPDVALSKLEKRAHKLVEHVFPTFLTREAAMLGILQKKLAPEYRNKVPRPLGIQKDSRGFVRTLHMNWMRIGGEPISQLDFAIQSAELLAAIHEQAGIMHLDLRMDNMVITPNGVGFVDFGSACKIGEQVNQSPMLGELFTEMMRTSQIQRMLGKMIERGHVTNNAISEVYGKTDKTVDSFYLAVQIAKPHANPDLKQLINYEPESDTAGMLSALTAAVLRPKNPEMAVYKSAADLVRGLHRIERRVNKLQKK
ncbi:MAG: hypothetical protein AB8C95_14825 [Phycisphaeraceae bacterium]